MNVIDISNKYGMSISMIMDEIEKGVKYEEKNVKSKADRLKLVLGFIAEHPTYYSDKIRLSNELK